MSSFLQGRGDTNVIIDPPLSQAVGYVVVVGIGLIIAFGKTFNISVMMIKSDFAC
jgi:hypothetical protein